LRLIDLQMRGDGAADELSVGISPYHQGVTGILHLV